jgi:hypothetical protein
MKALSLTIVLFLAACSPQSAPVPAPASCKLSLIFCPAGYRCNIATDLCEPCSDGGVCDDAGR